MTVENDFLPFAVGTTANVEAQADFAADTSTLQNGFQSGIANSQKLNKVWRQSSIMSAVLAQLIVDRTGQAAIDDGTSATLLANLKLAAAAVSGDATKVFSVAPATQSQHAVQLGQAQLSFFPRLGGTELMTANVSAGAYYATFTDDSVTVATALNGTAYRIPNFSATVDLTKTGIGGLDAGTAPVGSYLLIYAAYNPTTGAYGAFASVETSTNGKTIYAGANPPSGYTATALIACVPVYTTAGYFGGFVLNGRKHRIANLTVYSGTSTATAMSLAAVTMAIPYCARRTFLTTALGTGQNLAAYVAYASSASGIGYQSVNGDSSAGALTCQYGTAPVDIAIPRTIYAACWSSSTQNAAYSSTLSEYEI